ncbi:IPT/TIG domain-containing protein [uncultured Lacinutrix sp.]|uniref:IPT/TIG domain-containing protein n=1 Tax=uncultured Lacinutrix sp. TaxID=574032 RepID=UPI0026057AA5|nr:IPT/TIG domain-containing protein [uncultured Lacinutrix sp.]
MNNIKFLSILFFLLLITACSKDETKPVITDPLVVDQVTVNSYTPTQGYPEEIVTISGVNFDASITNNTVSFNNVLANIINITTTQISITVPNAPAGNYTITLNTNNENITVGNFEILEDSKILAFSPLGKLHEVFTGSGRSNLLDTIDFDFWSQGNLNLIDFSDDILYITDWSLSEYRILEYNINTQLLETTTNNYSNIPELTNTNFPAIVTSNFNTTDGLLYLLFAGDDIGNGNFPYYLYTFNPETEALINSNFSFDLDLIRSTFISNNTWYISSNNGTVKSINLQDNTIVSQTFNNPLHKVFKHNNQLYGLYKNPSQIEAKLALIDLTTGDLTDISSNTLGFLNPSGNGFKNTEDKFLDFTIVEDNDVNGFTNNGIYTYDILNNELHSVYLENQDLGYGTKILKELN